MLLFLSGCLLLAKGPECDEAECSPYACETTGLSCVDYCIHDNDCASGYGCAMGGDCETACVDSECLGGYACGDYNECNDYCLNDSDCQSGWHCCDFLNEDCNSTECVL